MSRNYWEKRHWIREEEREAIDYQTPTLPMLQDMVLEYSSRIYERSILDDDFLKVNLGYRKGESQITVSYEDKELDMTKDELIDRAKKIPKEFQKVGQIPVEIDLKKAHLGLVGNKRNIHEQLKYLLAQLTFFQSYRELQIVFIHSGAYTEDFQYMRWYPHLRLEFINVIGEIYSEQIRDQILGSIQQILKERKLKQEEEKKAHIFLPYLLFIIDEPKLILNHAIMEYLQSREMELGFSMIYTTDQQSNLPENIRTICILDNSEEAHLLLEEGERKNLRFEVQHTEGIPLEKMARALSPLIHEQGITSQVPDKLTFFEMYGVDNTEQLEVEKRWESHSAYKSLAVPIGAKAENDFTELNLHEKAHGPHGLVAGTTGSGKSETIQTYILSLAVNFHPHEVGFLLIDYKGGGMANLFADLPHLLGTITNLDKAESTMPMLPSYPGYEKTICKVPIGLDTDTLQVYYLPMEQAPAFILGNAKAGKTNVIKNMLTLLSDEKVYVFDNKSHELAAYQSKENVVYAGDKSAVAAALDQIKEEVFARKEEYEEAKLDDVSLSMETFVKTLPPIYVMVDMLQELYENVEEDNSRIDILEEAVRYGIYVLVTSEFKVKKMTRSKFIEMLLASREVLILGNIKDQLLFSYTGVREENRKVEFGYYHNAGVNRKVKLIFHREMK